MSNSKSLTAIEVSVQTLNLIGKKEPTPQRLQAGIGLRLESDHVLFLGEEIDGIQTVEIQKVSHQSWRNPSGDWKLLQRVPVVKGMETILHDQRSLCPSTRVTARIISLDNQ
jgi:hypothetical protein